MAWRPEGLDECECLSVGGQGPWAKMGNAKISEFMGQNREIYSGRARSEGTTRWIHGKLKWTVGSMTLELRDNGVNAQRLLGAACEALLQRKVHEGRAG